MRSQDCHFINFTFYSSSRPTLCVNRARLSPFLTSTLHIATLLGRPRLHIADIQIQSEEILAEYPPDLNLHSSMREPSIPWQDITITPYLRQDGYDTRTIIQPPHPPPLLRTNVTTIIDHHIELPKHHRLRATLQSDTIYAQQVIPRLRWPDGTHRLAIHRLNTTPTCQTTRRLPSQSTTM